jgi:periplasmic divalent cation tolerance protein
MTDFVLVSTTTASATAAEQIATTLVEQRWAACVQIIPQVRSVYRWEGKIERADEHLCLVKTRRSLLPQVEAEVLRQHAYECPEIIALPIEASSAGYLQWLESQLPL